MAATLLDDMGKCNPDAIDGNWPMRIATPPAAPS
jgi:hypothetical protein